MAIRCVFVITTVVIVIEIEVGDSKLLQDSSLTTGHRHKTLHISFKRRRRIVSEGLANITGIIRGANSRPPVSHAKMLPLLCAPKQLNTYNKVGKG